MDDLYPGWDGLAEAASLLQRWVLGPLSRGEPGRYRRYDWERDAYGGWVDLPQPDTLVVEGCASGSRLAAPYLSLLLWVEASRETRLRRGLERDGEAYGPHWERWAAQEDVLFAAEGTRDRADLRVDGDPSIPHDPRSHIVLLRSGVNPTCRVACRGQVSDYYVSTPSKTTYSHRCSSAGPGQVTSSTTLTPAPAGRPRRTEAGSPPVRWPW